MRISTATTFLTMQAALANSYSTVGSLTDQMSTGRRINQLSDDPVGAAQALRYGSEITSWDTYNTSAADAQSRLGLTDSTLQSMLDTLHSVTSIAVASQNGAISPQALAANAAQLNQLRGQIADLANTSYQGQALLGGFSATAVAHDAASDTYSFTGNAGVVNRQVAPNVTLQVNLDGATMLGFSAGAGNDLFSQLKALSTAVASGNTAGVQAAAGAITSLTDKVSQALGSVGSLTNRVTAAQTVGTSAVQQLKNERSSLVDIDLASTTLELSQAKTAYEAALTAAAQASQLPSLASFLK